MSDPYDHPEPVEAIVVTEPRGRITPAEVVTLGQLLAQGKTLRQIAEVMDRRPATLQRHVHEAKALLQALSPEMVELWLESARKAAKRGNHHPMRDWLIGAGAVAPPAEKSGPAVQVNIGFKIHGLPEPALPDPSETG